MDLAGRTDLDYDSLYNEGLLLKYSEKSYDNTLVALHNIKEVYDLNYLTQPMFMYDPYGSSQYVDNNVVYTLRNLAFRFGDLGYKEAARRLEEFLEKVYKQDTGSYYYYPINRRFD
jgi:hypothetical protein